MFALETRNIFFPAETVIGASFPHGFRNGSKSKFTKTLSCFRSREEVVKTRFIFICLMETLRCLIIQFRWLYSIYLLNMTVVFKKLDRISSVGDSSSLVRLKWNRSKHS